MSFVSKVVVVTGATSGIGAATAVAFAKELAFVVLVGRNEEKLKEVAKQCTASRDPYIIKADVSEDADCERIINETISKFKKIDILVNNAGILRGNLLEKGNTVQVYDEIMKTNLRAVVHLTTLATPYLIERKGNIVNISSAGGSQVFNPLYNIYGVSKAALNHFTKGAALELAKFGVRANLVSPGPVKTNIFAAAGIKKTYDEINLPTALNRWSEPEEIADLILFVASDKARGITGSNYLIDNGVLLL